MNDGENEGSVGDENKSDMKQYLFAISCCNKLALLLSQCSVTQYQQRIKTLIQLIHYWKQNIDVSVTIVVKDSAQQSLIQLKEEPCLQDCQLMEKNTSPDIDEQDEDFQFDRLSSQYLTFDAFQNSSNEEAFTSADNRLGLTELSSAHTIPEETNSNDNLTDSLTMITSSLLDGFEVVSDAVSNILQHSCNICGAMFNSRVDRNKHLRAYHLDRLISKKKSKLLSEQNKTVNLSNISSMAHVSKTDVVDTDKNKTSVVRINNTSAGKKSVDQISVDRTSPHKASARKPSPCKTNVSKASKTSVNNSNDSGVRKRKNIERTAAEHKTSNKADNKVSKKSKTVQSNVTDIYSNQLCVVYNDCDDSNDDNTESENETTTSVVDSKDVRTADANQQLDANDIKDNEKLVNSEEGEISCTKCDIKFTSETSYKIHIGQYHNNKLKIGIPRNPYKCSICPKQSYANLKTLKRHMISYHNVTGPLQEYENGGYACELCDKRYETKKGLLLHLHEHDPAASKPFECSTCGMRFKQKFRLKSHNLVHTGERPYKCTMCDKAYQQHHNLKDHIKIVHLNDRPFICSVCGSDFVTSTQLKYHLRMHSGEKPHKCDICNKSFRIPRQLYAHKYIHRNYMAFVCKVCGAQFKASGNLHRHSLLHSDKRRHSCSICGKNFIQPGNLRVHMRVHSGERPYVCDICGMSFPHYGTWKKHEETHK